MAWLVPACMLAFPAAASERHLLLKYEIFVGGLRTFHIAYDARLRPAAYDMKLSLEGKGVLDWWFSWQMEAYSEGRLAQGAVAPIRAGADSTWRGRQRRIRLIYPPSGLPRVDIRPVPEDDDRETVAADLRKGARDLSGAILALLSRVGTADRCDVREAVFDGRRRYDLVMKHLGRDRLEPNQYSPFGGPALRCSLEIDRIAGYRRDGSHTHWGIQDAATIWIARPFDGVPPLPVRLELDTPLGALRAHLVDATIRFEGAVRSLAAVP